MKLKRLTSAPSVEEDDTFPSVIRLSQLHVNWDEDRSVHAGFDALLLDSMSGRADAKLWWSLCSSEKMNLYLIFVMPANLTLREVDVLHHSPPRREGLEASPWVEPIYSLCLFPCYPT